MTIKIKSFEKKSKPYNNTKVKARNFVTNIAYRRFKDSDFKKDNFVVDLFPFSIKNLNPTMLDQKFDSDIERDYIKMMREKCVPKQFCRFCLFKR